MTASYTSLISSSGAIALAHSRIENLDVKKIRLNEDSAKEFAKDSNLHKLIIHSGDSISSNSVIALAQSASLTHLGLHNSYNCDDDVIAAVFANTHISHLYLTGDLLKDTEAKLLANASHIVELDVTGNRVSHDGIAALNANPYIARLVTGDQYLRDDAKQVLKKEYVDCRLKHSYSRLCSSIYAVSAQRRNQTNQSIG